MGLKDTVLTDEKWASQLVLCCPVVHDGWNARGRVDSPLGDQNLLNTAYLALSLPAPCPPCRQTSSLLHLCTLELKNPQVSEAARTHPNPTFPDARSKMPYKYSL